MARLDFTFEATGSQGKVCVSAKIEACTIVTGSQQRDRFSGGMSFVPLTDE